jgi:hypothetical protein
MQKILLQQKFIELCRQSNDFNQLGLTQRILTYGRYHNINNCFLYSMKFINFIFNNKVHIFGASIGLVLKTIISKPKNFIEIVKNCN